MGQAALMVWSNPVAPDREDDFNEWYDSVHIPQIRELMSQVRTVHRYRLAGPDDGAVHRYLAVYELECDDVEGPMKVLGEAVASGTIIMTDAMDVTANPPVTQWYAGLV